MDYAIYLAFSVYLLGVLFLGLGVYRLLAGMIRPAWLNWLLLPGTIVSEMAWIFGCLITGGEIRRAKFMEGGKGGGKPADGAPAKGGGGGGSAEPATEGAPKLGFFGPVLAALFSIVACGAGIYAANQFLGQPVIHQFQHPTPAAKTARSPLSPSAAHAAPTGQPAATAGNSKSPAESYSLPQAMPSSGDQFWDQVSQHLGLVRRMVDTVTELEWTNWRVPLFVYLAGCLSIRLFPVRRPVRASLLAVVVAAGVIAIIGLVWRQFSSLMSDLWPLVTYVWTSLMFLLLAALVVRGVVGLIKAIGGKEAAPKKAAA